MRRQKRKRNVDSVAAAIVLQSYLDSARSRPGRDVTAMRVARLVRDVILVGPRTILCLVAIETFCQASVSPEKFVHVVVDKGMTFSQIAARFRGERPGEEHDLVFKVLGRAFRIERRAKAGRYRFEPDGQHGRTSCRALYRGATYREQILIPPGRQARADSRDPGAGGRRGLDRVRRAGAGLRLRRRPCGVPSTLGRRLSLARDLRHRVAGGGALGARAHGQELLQGLQRLPPGAGRRASA